MRELLVTAQNLPGQATELNISAVRAEFFALPHFKVLLVRTERIPVMLPNHGFHFIGVVGFDRFENLTVFFLSVW